MLGLILAVQSALLMALHLAMLALARWLGEHPPSRADVLVGTGRLVAILGVFRVVALPGLTGHGFLAVQLLVFGVLAAGAALRPSAARAHVMLLQALLFSLFFRFLVWRGLFDDAGPTDVLRYVFDDFAAQLLLPSVSALHQRLLGAAVTASPFLAWLRLGVHQAATGVAAHVVLLGGLTTHALSVVTVRAVTSRPAPATLRSLLPFEGGALGVIGLVVLVVALPSVSAVLRAAVLGLLVPALIAEALVELDRLSSRLRSGRLPLVMLGAALPFTPTILHALAALGALFALLPLSPLRIVTKYSRARLLAWSGSGLLAVLAFASVAGISGHLLSPARNLPAEAGFCPDTRFVRAGDAVLVHPSTGVAPFRIDVEERPLGGLSPDAAQAACGAEHKRLCSSEEIFVVCACDHGLDGYPRTGSPVPRDGLVARARCGTSADAPECASEHGVRGLLGGRSEVTGTVVADGAYSIAGANDWLHENWMVHCRWRGLMSEEALAASAHPMLGFRCCAAGE